jgi:hypothetical protein
MKYLKIYFLGLLLTTVLGNAFSQLSDDDSFVDNLYVSGGVTFNKQKFGEIGIGYGFISPWGACDCGPQNLNLGLKLASEFGKIYVKEFGKMDAQKFILAPKISAEVHVRFVGARINFIDYTDFTYHDIKFTPEIGISGNGLINLFYGYNFALSKNHLNGIARNRLTLVFNFGKGFLD